MRPYVYSIKDTKGLVGPHPDGPFVHGLPQFKLIGTIFVPDVQFVKKLNRGDGDKPAGN